MEKGFLISITAHSASNIAVHCQVQEGLGGLRRTDGSWVRPDRRQWEGVATQEVIVNYAACSSHLQMKRGGQYLGRRVPMVSAAAAWRQFQPKFKARYRPKSNRGIFRLS